MPSNNANVETDHTVILSPNRNPERLTVEEHALLLDYLQQIRAPEAHESTPLTFSPALPAGAIVTDRSLPGCFANSPIATSRILMDVEKLGIPVRHRELFRKVNIAVIDHMSQPPYENSHDYEHILRVCTIALRLFQVETGTKRARAQRVDPVKLFLACMVHDVGDGKYEKDESKAATVKYDMLIKCGASHDLAVAVNLIANSVSFTGERKNPEPLRKLVEAYPELAIVQDSDRLDGLGAVGQARCFAYGGATEPRKRQSLNIGVQFNWSRFRYYPGMMKTGAGKKEAWKRWARMLVYSQWFAEETDVSSVLP